MRGPTKPSALKSVALMVGIISAGVGIALLDLCLFFPLWFKLGWRKPVAYWLLSQGFPNLAVQWGLVWVRLTTWAEGVLVGMLIGRLLYRRWILNCVLVGLAMLLTPYFAAAFEGVYPGQLYGARIELLTAVWDSILLPLLLVSALLGTKLRPRRIQPGICSNCDYDLTGNTSGMCSECGTPVRK